jgi:hypothetical protein
MVPPHLVRRVAATFDDAIAACLRETACARGAPDDARWRRALKQAQLPVRLGGLGLTSAAGQADAAWCGSWAQCWSRMQGHEPEAVATPCTELASTDGCCISFGPNSSYLGETDILRVRALFRPS